MKIHGKRVVLTGGSKGLGYGIAEALSKGGAKLEIVGRDKDALNLVRTKLGVSTIVADITDQTEAGRIVAEANPDILILNAGIRPPMQRIDKIGWNDFSATWNTDVKAALHWMQASLTLPLKRGSLIVLMSSGAAISGSPLSGGYAGAKRAMWYMADYANSLSDKEKLELRFVVLNPTQMIEGTGVGDTGLGAYSAAAGMNPSDFANKFFRPMPPIDFGSSVAKWLEDDGYQKGTIFGIRAETGVVLVEPNSK